MLSIKIPNYKILTYRYMPIGLILGCSFLCEIFTIFQSEFSVLITAPFKTLSFTDFYLNSITIWRSEIIQVTNIEVFAGVLYTHYVYLFLMSGIILLVSMIGAITLTLHRRVDVKRQKIYKQVQQDFLKSIKWTNSIAE